MSVVAIAAGGTAGHVNPALALAGELRSRGHEVRFFGTVRGMEAELVPAEGYPYEGLDVSGFDRSRPWTAVTALVKTRAARSRVLKGFAEKGAPDVAVGFGAYVEFPLAQAAAHAGIPLVLHEQNSVPGMANVALAKKAQVVALTYPSTAARFEGRVAPGARVEVTGNPVRAAVLAPTREQGRAKLDIPADATVLLVFGGSLGAQHVNRTAARLKDALLARPDLVVLHAAGKRDFDETRATLALTPEQERRWRLLPYIDDMGSCLAAADLVLSRAGASSVAEIAARCVPSVLVPYPYATENHQATNAGYLVEAGGARLVDDAALDGPDFDALLLGLVDDPDGRARMRASLEGLGCAQAAARLADAVEQAAARRPVAPRG